MASWNDDEEEEIPHATFFSEMIDTISDGFLAAFADVFTASSYDPITGKFNYLTLEEIAHSFHLEQYNPHQIHKFLLDEINRYRQQPLVLFTSFIGLTNQSEFRENDENKIYIEDLTWEKILFNLQGLQEEKSDERKRLNKYLSPFVLIKNIVFAGLISLQNLVKVFTEFLPLLLVRSFEFLMNYSMNTLDEIWSRDNVVLNMLHSILPVLAFIFACTGYLLIKPVYLIGRAFSSPIDSIKAAWYGGLSLNDFFDKKLLKKYPALKIIGYSAAVLLSMISIAATATLYAFLFPLMITAIPGVSTWLSSALINTSSSALGFISSHVIIPLLTKLGLSATLDPLVVGLCSYIGIAITALFPFLAVFFDKYRDCYYHTGNPEIIMSERTITRETSHVQKATPEMIEAFKIKQEASYRMLRKSGNSIYAAVDENNDVIPENSPEISDESSLRLSGEFIRDPGF